MLFKQDDTAAVEDSLPPWKVLIVDDEPDIHSVTKMALRKFRLNERGLSFLHAYSGEEARQIMAQHSDIAVIFLDVVMESDDAGLQVARYIREELDNQFSRIVLRTGQPGQAPESRVIVEYDINDYKEKTELDNNKLFTTTYAALRAYRDIELVDEARRYQERSRKGLEHVLHASASLFEQRSLKEFASGLLLQIASLLHVSEDSVLLQCDGLSGLKNLADNELHILAASGSLQGISEMPEDVVEGIQAAMNSQRSQLINDSFIGYFPSKQDKVTLLYIKGVKNIDELDQQLMDIFSTNVSIAFENLLLDKEIEDTQAELIHRLGDVVENRSKEAANHVVRMAEFSYVLGKKAGLSDGDAELLRKASPMHDLGKIGIPDSVLLKPGKLDADEWQVMQSHARLGAEMLAGSERPLLHAAAIIAEQHHERFDGSGYPKGLSGSDIHLYARIVAIADVFDALIHKRCYKEPWPMEKVLQLLEDEKGKHFDPELVELFLANLDEMLEISKRYPDLH
ncbi:DUF3369 domain-containing protein [Oceanospirillum sediminis]|uniref:DUF3369 domain-containing protein n=1 Tax=Oceanospirillum sediminis TaxID=2760088 RepID=A0A839IV01_9GAMM|nr:DUF3369 domain-containing protein [Oceanospirillum sediminis]MBB1488791.1 DUF3369 domain-containing protein [Oceanospirillum sediminis]